MNELQAVRRLKSGDIGGLETLVRAYQVRALRAAYFITHDQGLAEDIVQRAFVRAYERIAQFDENRPFGPWFLKSIVNDAIRAAARRQHEVYSSVDLDDENQSGLEGEEQHVDPAVLFQTAETAEDVRKAVLALSPKQRAAIVYRYFEGFTDAETAHQLGLSISSVKWHLHAARRRLRQLLPRLRPDLDIPGQDEPVGPEGAHLIARTSNDE